MDSFYLEIRALHIATVLASGLLFLLRAASFNLLGASWPMLWPVRWLAYAIDTTLLTAALMLMTIIQQYPFANGWLTAKILLLLVYVALAYVALRGPTRQLRLAALVGAAAIFGIVYNLARAHHIFGLFA